MQFYVFLSSKLSSPIEQVEIQLHEWFIYVEKNALTNIWRIHHKFIIFVSFFFLNLNSGRLLMYREYSNYELHYRYDYDELIVSHLHIPIYV